MLKFITDRQIYDEVVCGMIPKARRLLWLATADLKDLHVHKQGSMVPFLEVLSDLVRGNVEVRLLHAKEPGPIFRRDFDLYPNLIAGLERMLCPRVHAGKYLITSPVGQGLVGKKVGDRAEIAVPRGLLKFEILNIRYDG